MIRACEKFSSELACCKVQSRLNVGITPQNDGGIVVPEAFSTIIEVAYYSLYRDVLGDLPRQGGESEVNHSQKYQKYEIVPHRLMIHRDQDSEWS